MDALLSSEQIGLLRWIGAHEPCTHEQLRTQNAPGYDLRRMDDLGKGNWINWAFRMSESLKMTPEYSLSDKARAYLEQLDKEAAEREKQAAKEREAEAVRLKEQAFDRAKERRYQAAQNKVAIIAALIGAGTSALLTLLVEHFSAVVTFLGNLFR